MDSNPPAPFHPHPPISAERLQRVSLGLIVDMLSLVVWLDPERCRLAGIPDPRLLIGELVRRGAVVMEKST